MGRRKTRITKEEIIKAREAKKNYNSQKAKTTIKPGPYTNLEPTFNTSTKLKSNTNLDFANIPIYYGSYQEKQWSEKGWYPIAFNIELNETLIQKHGMDLYLSAVEKSLTKQRRYGAVVILSIYTPFKANDDKTYLSIEAKTNKKSIEGFVAMRENKLTLLQA